MGTFSRITTDHLYDYIDASATTAAPLFNMYGWTYGEDRPPTHSELVDCITRLTDSALDSFYNSEEEFREAEVRSGRFCVSIREYEDEVAVNIRLEIGGHSWFKA